MKWLSQEEKGLIDFSDLGEMKSKPESAAKVEKGNNIKVDTWGW